MNSSLFVIAGPCVIESAGAVPDHRPARESASATSWGSTYIFKASFDKANRSSNASFRGPGLTTGWSCWSA